MNNNSQGLAILNQPQLEVVAKRTKTHNRNNEHFQNKKGSASQSRNNSHFYASQGRRKRQNNTQSIPGNIKSTDTNPILSSANGEGMIAASNMTLNQTCPPSQLQG